MPVDGTFPTGTTQYEKRSIAEEIPIWDPKICIQCGLCSLGCPHASIRMKVFEPSLLEKAPAGFKATDYKAKEYPGWKFVIQVAPDDCTGCGLCVDVCPAKDKTQVKHKAIDMEPKIPHLERERAGWDFFLTIPDVDRTKVKLDTVKGSQFLLPLFEFSGACAGCGETPYVKLITQLFGDRMLIGNATGCSSIYGGNLPCTPYTQTPEGKGPAWSNSLFEDCAEFGMGFRLAIDQQLQYCHALLARLSGQLGDEIVKAADRQQAGDATPRSPCSVRWWRRSSSGWRPSAAATRRTWRPRPITWSAAACGASAATAGPTTSVSAAWTTSSPRAAT